MTDRPTAVDSFAIDLPTRIRFGPGVRRSVGMVVAAYGGRTALVTGSSFASNAGAAEVLASLADAGVTVVFHETIATEPDDRDVLRLAAMIRRTAPDSLVAVGGGSPLDLAKAVALQPSSERLEAWLHGERVEAGGTPVVALPTTAGSGAEVSHAAIILDRSAGRKRGIRGRGVAARVALVDPELMAGAPSRVSAASGFDAIAHAVETAVSRAASPFVVDLAGVALRRLLRYVPTVVADPDDRPAWTETAYAAMLMGINLANSTTCLPHRLQYPVGAWTGTAHSVGVAALTPAWLSRTRIAAPQNLARVARAAGLAGADDHDAAAATALVEHIEEHLTRTAMRRRLRDLGVRRVDIDALVDSVEGSVANDPGPSDRADIRALYETSW